MKKVLFLFITALFVFSCQENDQDFLDSKIEKGEINVRAIKKDCTQNFTPGNVDEGLFGGENPVDIGGTFSSSGWKGTFEEEYFPCEQLYIDDGCCTESFTEFHSFGLLPFSTTCNEDLDTEELEDLAAAILDITNANSPTCEGILLNPVAINVIVDRTLCCVMGPPCDDPETPTPCDCYDEYPDDEYWACCQTYYLSLQVRYARTTACPEELKPTDN